MTSNTSGFTPSRRTLVKGAAWSVPVVAMAGGAPAMAASPPIPPNGLNGWVTLSRRCQFGADFFIDGRGTFTGGGANDRGIWTFVPDPDANITFAQIIFYFDRSDLSFTNSSGAGWSNLTRAAVLDGGAPGYAYETQYTGLWTYYPGSEAWVADTDPYWSSNLGSGCAEITAYARRTITVNDETVSFLRGPVYV